LTEHAIDRQLQILQFAIELRSQLNHSRKGYLEGLIFVVFGTGLVYAISDRTPERGIGVYLLIFFLIILVSLYGYYVHEEFKIARIGKLRLIQLAHGFPFESNDALLKDIL
jgi:hypothetical protein